VDAFQEGAKEIIGGKMIRAILKRKQMKSFPDALDMDSGGESSDNDDEDGEENMGYRWGIAG